MKNSGEESIIFRNRVKNFAEWLRIEFSDLFVMSDLTSRLNLFKAKAENEPYGKLIPLTAVRDLSNRNALPSLMHNSF